MQTPILQSCEGLARRFEHAPKCSRTIACRTVGYRAAHRRQDGDSRLQEHYCVPAAIRRGVIAVATAAWCSTMPLPVSADVPMVSSTEVTAAAKPIAKQPVQKGKVWLLLAGGSAALFASTVLLERSRVFPAIAKANEAMSLSKATREGAQTAEPQEAALDVQPESSSWSNGTASSTAVLAGLQSASDRVLKDKETDAANPDSDLSSISSPVQPASATQHSAAETESISKSSSSPQSSMTSAVVAQQSAPDAHSSNEREPSPSAAGVRHENGDSSTAGASMAVKRGEGKAASETAPTEAVNSRSAASPLSELSSAGLDRLILAKQHQQQEQKVRQQGGEGVKSASKEAQPAAPSKDLADLSEEELQSLIASKRNMAANVVKTVVDP